MKPEIRLLGIDDSPFDKFHDRDALVIGTIFRGGSFLDGVLSTRVTVDGDDATEKLSGMITASKFHPQLQAILLDGIAVAGFNVVDIQELRQQTGIPVIVVMRDHPDLELIESALKKLNHEDKLSLLMKAGSIHKVDNIYIQLSGISLAEAEEILAISCTHSLIPEPIRAAHLIASGVVEGQSRGRA